MKRSTLFLASLLLSACASLGPTASYKLPSSTTQLLVVTTDSWQAVQGTAQRFERRGSTFYRVGQAFPIVVGKTGLGWGRGLPLPKLSGPVKKEGDGRAPAGIFGLGTAFGYHSTAVTELPYLQLTPSIECNDDSRSARYNTLVDINKIKMRFDDDPEHMLRNDDLYEYGIFVNHNTPPVSEGGSCIFLHIWRYSYSGTVGCTAMERPNILILLKWLDPKDHPLLVQMPRNDYQQLRNVVGLPSL